MKSKNQIRANRANAKKSTGPRTQEGKARSSQNALKHGLLANDAVLPGEDPADFDRHLTSFEDTYLPRNRVEKEIVRQIADVAWRMQRLSRIETAVIAAGIANTRQFNLETGPIPDDRAGQTQQLGRAMITRTQVLNNLARYDGHLARRFFCSVELMINIRREDRQLREAYEAKNAGATTPVHYLPDEDPSSAHPSAIGFRPAEKLASETAKTIAGEKLGTVPSAAEKTSLESKTITGAKRTFPHFFQWGRSPALPSHQPKTAPVCEKEGPTTPQNQEPRNEAKTDLTPACTTSYKQKRAPEAALGPHGLR